MTAPPFAYYGGKQRLATRIAGGLPAHDHYIEPFAGSLAVLLAKPVSRMETANDLSGDLMLFWRMLRDEPAEMARVCTFSPHSRADFVASQERPDDLSDLERARRVWVCLTQGRSPSLRGTGWRFNVDSYTAAMPTYVAAYLRRLAPAAERLARVTLENRPALDVIEQYGKSDRVCLYVDPPYLQATRSGTGYALEMAGEAEHRALAEALRGCRSAVVLSGYASPLYEELFDGWSTAALPASTGQGQGATERTEVLWSNRPIGDQPSLWDGVAS